MTWLPGYVHVPLGKAGGSYDRTNNPKLVWHTTEGGSLAGAETAFYSYPPHLGVDPDAGMKHQYIDLDRHAYSMGNSDAEDSYAIQVEVVGYAAETHTWSDRRLQWLAEHVVVPVQQAVGVPDTWTDFYGEGSGFVLASPSSPIRLSMAEWDGFTGHVGHQHVPGDDHWDPGALPIDRILDYAQPQPEPEVDMAAPATCTDSRGRPWLFYRGSNGECWARCQGDPPFSLGGQVTDAIAAVPGPDANIDVYAYVPGGAVYSIHADGVGWGRWYAL